MVDTKRLVDIRDGEEGRIGRDVRRVRKRGLDISNLCPGTKEMEGRIAC